MGSVVDRAGPRRIGLLQVAVSLGYLLVLRFILFVPVTVLGCALLLIRQRRRA